MGCLRVPILFPALFDILINRLDGGADYRFIEFANNAKLGRMINTLEDRIRMQLDLDRRRFVPGK